MFPFGSTPHPAPMAGLVAFLVVSTTVAQALPDSRIHLKNVTYDLESGPPPVRSLTLTEEAAAGGLDTWIVVIAGPRDGHALRAIEESGGRIVGYVPNGAYLVRATPAGADRMRGERAVRRIDRYEPAWKIAPGLANEELLSVDVFAGESVALVADRARALGFEVLRAWETDRVRRVVLRAPLALRTSEARERMAAFSAVEWIEPVHFATLRNDTVRWVIQSNVDGDLPLFEHGILGAGQIGGLIDGAMFMGSCFFQDPNLTDPGPTHRKVVSYHSSTGLGSSPHGTHVAGIFVGDREPTVGSILTRGMAPKARIAFTNVNDVEGSGTAVSNLDFLLTQAHADGARVHSNSWGDDLTVLYTSWCRDIDAFSRQNEEDLVIFAVSNFSEVHTPENAKNCLAVGSAMRPPNHENISSGGAGPTADGRRKPEVYAPGENTNSAAVSSCATGANTGTSMAAPAVAGAALLVREYFMRGFYPTGAPNAGHAFTPTGALVKAILVNSADDMSGVIGYPSNSEGWGRILLDDALVFSGDPERLSFRDRRHVSGLATGESDVSGVRVVDPTVPLRVTLVFTDQPAALAASFTPVNDLDLEVEGPGGLFLGNVFAGGESQTGGSADPLNCVERVVVRVPAPGDWQIRVRGRDVPMGPQGYALVTTGGLFHADRMEIVDPPELDAPPTGRTQPTSAEILPPRPNPFSGEASFRLALPASSPVRVAIYNVQGRLVRLLLDRAVDAGEQDVRWGGEDENGTPVPAGIYFARLTGPGFDRQVKGVLLR